MFKKIIFVCTANTCRSPVAEGALKKIRENALANWDDLSEKEKNFWNKAKEIEIKSIGLATFPGMPATFESVNYAEKFYRIDLHQHRSSRLSPYDLEEGSFFLCMTEQHAAALIAHKNEEKAFEVETLLSFVHEKEKNILDPYGFSEKVYEEMVHQIYSACQRVWEKLQKVDEMYDTGKDENIERA